MDSALEVLARRRRGAAGLAAATIRVPVSRVLAWAGAAPVTWSLVGVLAGVWALEQAVMGQVHGGRPIGYLSLGALSNVSVAGRGGPGEWWRYLSSPLIHVSLVHLLFNSLALLVIGGRVERLYGHLVMLGTFVLTASLAGALWVGASTLGLAPLGEFSVGASGGLCGLIGLLTMFGRMRRGNVDRRLAATSVAPALVVTALVVATGFVFSNVNNFAHAGGLVSGLLLGVCTPPLPGYGGRRLHRVERAVLGLLVAALLLAVGVAGQHLVHRLLEP